MLHYTNLWRHLVMDVEGNIGFPDIEDFWEVYSGTRYDQERDQLEYSFLYPCPREFDAAARMLRGYTTDNNRHIFVQYMMAQDPQAFSFWNDRGGYCEVMLDDSEDCSHSELRYTRHIALVEDPF